MGAHLFAEREHPLETQVGDVGAGDLGSRLKPRVARVDAPGFRIERLQIWRPGAVGGRSTTAKQRDEGQACANIQAI